MKQLPLPIAPPAADRFDALVVGPNAQAVQHLRGLAAGQGLATPVYLWGPAGSGKTRLLRALAAEHQAAGGLVAWFDADTPLPWSVDERHTLVLLDACERLDAARQQAAFSLYILCGVQAQPQGQPQVQPQAQVQVPAPPPSGPAFGGLEASAGAAASAPSDGVLWVAAGRLPPVDLPLRDDLRTRLGWGHVLALAPLSEADTRAALRREADRRGIRLSDEVMGYVLTRFDRQLQHLMALLDRLDDFALAEQRAVTVPLLKKMLAQASDPEPDPRRTDAARTDEARPV